MKTSCLISLLILLFPIQSIFAQNINTSESVQYSPEITTHYNIIVPKAFSPNYDGINDFFKVIYKDVEEYNIKIYNRYGQLVYESDDIRGHWDGSYRNESTVGGVYVWIIRYAAYNKNNQLYNHTLKGSLTIIL